MPLVKFIHANSQSLAVLTKHVLLTAQTSHCLVCDYKVQHDSCCLAWKSCVQFGHLALIGSAILISLSPHTLSLCIYRKTDLCFDRNIYYPTLHLFSSFKQDFECSYWNPKLILTSVHAYITKHPGSPLKVPHKTLAQIETDNQLRGAQFFLLYICPRFPLSSFSNSNVSIKHYITVPLANIIYYIILH